MKTWGRAITSAFVFAAIMGAGQVGVATVLDVLRLDGAYADDNVWLAQTAFLAWFAVIAVAAGTAIGAHSAGLGVRVSAAVAAGIGGAAGTAIALFPARHAQLPNGDPALQAGLALTIGAAAGLVFAFAILSARSLAWSAGAYALVVWGLIAGGVAKSADAPPRLGGLAGLGLSPAAVDDAQLFGLPAIAAVLGVIVAVTARLRGHHRLAVALSGAAGPATVALAYAIAGPGSSDFQKLPWVAALGAVLTGLVASAIVAIPPRRQPDDATSSTLGTEALAVPAPTSAPDSAVRTETDKLPPRRESKARPAPARSRPRPTNDAVESWVSGLGEPSAATNASASSSSERGGFVPRPLG
ncbi:MAG: hypothetical protein HOU81_03465 [Hamadaea sp.]|uniref:hypothetical protein n=1 Tax=Hamadaea sp. TaxID=2024425 RepID=UPI0017962D9B|nr:hypothetical protein [Hamadaea sp.]NUR69855.1 hypothetical protein [Hamadaea sp.]NUT20100.1 hypothetical protein [Hamadaea sp.]